MAGFEVQVDRTTSWVAVPPSDVALVGASIVLSHAQPHVAAVRFVSSAFSSGALLNVARIAISPFELALASSDEQTEPAVELRRPLGAIPLSPPMGYNSTCPGPKNKQRN